MNRYLRYGLFSLACCTCLCILFSCGGSTSIQIQVSAAQSPQEASWVMYNATYAVIVFRAGHVPQDIYEENGKAYNALVADGIFVEIGYDWKNESVDAALDKMFANGLKGYRWGLAINGGQWPVGLITVLNVDAQRVQDSINSAKLNEQITK